MAGLGVVPQISNADPHPVQNAVGEAGRNRIAESGVHDSQRKYVAIAPKHLAKEKAAQEAERGKKWAWNMRDRKQRTGPETRAVSEKRFKPHKEERLQD